MERVAEIWATWTIFKTQVQKNKKNSPWQNFLHFSEKKFSSRFGMAADQAVK